MIHADRPTQCERSRPRRWYASAYRLEAIGEGLCAFGNGSKAVCVSPSHARAFDLVEHGNQPGGIQDSRHYVDKTCSRSPEAKFVHMHPCGTTRMHV